MPLTKKTSLSKLALASRPIAARHYINLVMHALRSSMEPDKLLRLTEGIKEGHRPNGANFLIATFFVAAVPMPMCPLPKRCLRQAISTLSIFAPHKRWCSPAPGKIGLKPSLAQKDPAQAIAKAIVQAKIGRADSHY